MVQRPNENRGRSVAWRMSQVNANAIRGIRGQDQGYGRATGYTYA